MDAPVATVSGVVPATEPLADDLVVEVVESNALIARSGGQRVGALRWRVLDAETVELIQDPDFPGAEAEVAAALVAAAEEVAAGDGFTWLVAGGVRRPLPLVLEIPTAAAMRELGVRLGELARAGDLVILTGDLGAGKTTLTQGIGAALGVEGPVTSPTFVLSRIHRGGTGRPDLVHVDAYRLGGLDEVDNIDLDSDVDHSVTVIEWGAGMAEQLSDDRLEIDIRRAHGAETDSRTVLLRPVGSRWADLRSADLCGALS